MAGQDEETKRKVRNRLSRARGQLDAAITAIDEGAACRDVIMQLAATDKAVRRAAFLIITSAMTTCLVEDEAEETPAEKLTQEDIEKIFLMLA